MNDLNRAINEMASSWKDFQQRDAERQSELTKRLDYLERGLDRKTMQDNRDRLGPLIGGADREISRERKAFLAWARTGDDREMKAVTIGTGSEGGYALPKEIEREIFSIARDASVIRKLSRVVQTTSNDFHALITNAGTASGWVGETTARTATNTATFYDVAPFMGDLYANAQVSQWALDDIDQMGDWVVGEIAAEFARAEDSAFVGGSGTNQPKGFLAYTTAATDDGARAFGTIEHVPTGVAGGWPASDSAIYDMLVTVSYKLKQAYRANASWVVTTGVLDKLRKVKDSTGMPIWSPGMGAQPPTLLGYPIYEDVHMTPIAANSLSIALGDFKAGYLIADRVGMSILRDPFTNKPNVCFYARKRTGGAVLDSNAIKLVKFSVS